MKKFITILSFFISIKCFSQFPITLKGNDAVQETLDFGARGTKGGFVWATNIADTTTANAQSFLKGTPGIVILINGNQLWIRSQDATIWTQIGGGAASARNGLTISSGFVELGGNMTKNDTIFTTLSNYVFAVSTSVGSTNPGILSVDFTRAGGTSQPGVINLDCQTFSGTGIKYIGKDPGNVKMQVDNTITPAEAAASGINYGNSLSGFQSRMINANIISQFALGGGGNIFADSGLLIRTTGKNIQFCVDGVGGGSFWFKGNSSDMVAVYGGFQGLGDATARFGVGTVTPGQKLAVIGSGRFTDSLLLTALLTGTTSDSVLVTSGGVTKRILQSSLVGSISVGTTTITAGTNKRIPFNDNGVYQEDAGLTYDKATKNLIITGTAANFTNLPKFSLQYTADTNSVVSYTAYNHDNVSMDFDAWYNPATSWTSSYAGSNYAIYKSLDRLYIGVNSGTAVGSTFGGFIDVFGWDVNGNVLHKSGSMSIGVTSVGAAKFNVRSTTEQQRTEYDASNYYKTTVSSTGGVTFDAVGAGSAFTFSDPVTGSTTINATTGFKVNGAAASGKILVGDGTNFVASTPTFPNASATLNKVIKSDGTNWVASTETYAAPGTSGNVLKSDGTNWTSAANTGEWTTLQVSGSDATTTGQTLVDVTGLVTPTLTASSNYEIEAMLIVTTSAVATGTEYGVNCTGGSTTQGIIYIGPSTVSAGVQVMNEIGTNTNNTPGTPAMLTTASETGVVWIRGVVGTGTGSPTIAIRHLKVTSGTSTVQVGSIMRYRKL